MSPELDELLSFWLGEHDAAGAMADRAALWWGKDEATDATLRARFGSLHDRAESGALDVHADTPRGRLALILVLDQLSRNLFRGTARMYATDERALQLSLDGIRDGLDRSLHPIERTFFYMPLMHSEDRTVQRRSVAAFEQLVREVDEAHRDAYRGFLEYAIRHAAIVERFGRYPHRNRILGRPSTDEELAFLQEPGSSF